MKKTGCILLFCLTILFCVACSIPGEKPESGFWYCEELKTGIDFDLYETTRYCVKVYDDDGNVKTNGCHFDYGSGICFFAGSNDSYNEYFNGTFKYCEESEQFTITNHSDGITYTFAEQERITKGSSWP